GGSSGKCWPRHAAPVLDRGRASELCRRATQGQERSRYGHSVRSPPAPRYRPSRFSSLSFWPCRCKRSARARRTDGRVRIEALTRLALAEHTLAPPTGPARAIGLALRRTRHDGLDRRQGRCEGLRRRALVITQYLRRRLAHGRAAPRPPFRRPAFPAAKVPNCRPLCPLPP